MNLFNNPSRLKTDDALALKNARRIPIDQIQDDPNQPRRTIASEHGTQPLHDLAADIEKHGVMQPITVIQLPESTEQHPAYRLVFGSRRLAAARLARLSMISALIINPASPTDILIMQFAENWHREPLSALDEAYVFQRLIDALRISPEQLSKLVHTSATKIRERLALLHDDVIAEAIRTKRITPTIAREVLRLDSTSKQRILQDLKDGKTVTFGDYLTTHNADSPHTAAPAAARRATTAAIDDDSDPLDEYHHTQGLISHAEPTPLAQARDAAYDEPPLPDDEAGPALLEQITNAFAAPTTPQPLAPPTTERPKTPPAKPQQPTTPLPTLFDTVGDPPDLQHGSRQAIGTAEFEAAFEALFDDAPTDQLPAAPPSTPSPRQFQQPDAAPAQLLPPTHQIDPLTTLDVVVDAPRQPRAPTTTDVPAPLDFPQHTPHQPPAAPASPFAAIDFAQDAAPETTTTPDALPLDHESTPQPPVPTLRARTETDPTMATKTTAAKTTHTARAKTTVLDTDDIVAMATKLPKDAILQILQIIAAAQKADLTLPDLNLCFAQALARHDAVVA